MAAKVLFRYLDFNPPIRAFGGPARADLAIPDGPAEGPPIVPKDMVCIGMPSAPVHDLSIGGSCRGAPILTIVRSMYSLKVVLPSLD